jgi:hypothetical protein
MKRLLTGIIAFALVSAVIGTGVASASSDTKTLTLDVTVPSSITLTLSSATVHCGSMVAGATSGRFTIDATVSTNNATGFTLTETGGAAPANFNTNGSQFQVDLAQDNSWQNVTTLSASQLRPGAGSFVYHHDYRCVIGAAQPPGTYSQDVTYLATTNA